MSTLSVNNVTEVGGAPVVTNGVLDSGSLPTIPVDKMPTGSVLQVVNFRAETQVTTTSTSYVTSGLEATITPSSASNKIVIFCTTGVEVANRTNAGEFALFRGGVAGTLLDMASVYPSYTSWINLNIAINHVDSPATTSPVTYTLGFKNSTNTSTTTYVHRYGKGNIILMEVAG